jgi:hypothetical protein
VRRGFFEALRDWLVLLFMGACIVGAFYGCMVRFEQVLRGQP